MIPHQQGQVLAFFAVALPVVLLPIAAYTVDAGVVSGQAAALQAAVADAAEVGAQHVDIASLRSSGTLKLDGAAARLAASQFLTAQEPGANLDQVSVSGTTVVIVASERVEVPLPLLARTLTLHARAGARLVPGYNRPSSLLLLPTSTF
ncbi:MAG: hypothetical protein ACREOM_14705 [Candidatus Dormibacteraceae bacterium]